ncbi:MAG: AIR carboxylase family protein, partial [Rothia dentocariosa]
MSSPYDSDKPVVGVVMGSDSDWSIMEEAATVLEEFGIPYEADVVSAHRMPEDMIAYGQQAHQRGIRVIIAGAGGAAHLPGMLDDRVYARAERVRDHLRWTVRKD